MAYPFWVSLVLSKKRRVTEDITGFAAVLYELLWQIAFAYTYELRYDDDEKVIWLVREAF